MAIKTGVLEFDSPTQFHNYIKIKSNESARLVYYSFEGGGGRFCEKMAREIVSNSKDFLYGEGQSKLPALSAKYRKWKDKHFPGKRLGELTGAMHSRVEAFRTGKSRRGWVVGFKENQKVAGAISPITGRFYGGGLLGRYGGTFHHGSTNMGRGKTGFQPPRPFVALAARRYLNNKFSSELGSEFIAPFIQLWMKYYDTKDARTR